MVSFLPTQANESEPVCANGNPTGRSCDSCGKMSGQATTVGLEPGRYRLDEFENLSELHSARSEHLAGERPGRFAIVDRRHAVDEDVRDAAGVLMRLRERR